ncbi:MAG: hypothetical protein DMF61_05810 [Blastocatellia bacterium AA13]|nr:MAG: hypothetical protein DMF61_05810 [Blastocatellia bacterium AA13]
MGDLTMNILGFAAVNRDLTVEVRDPITRNIVKEAKPFLDGTTRIPKLDPGAYEITVRHPNLALPVIRRPIRVLPTGDTKISVLIDPSQFRDTPIEEVPEANLTPVRGIARSVAETVTLLTNKHPGEAILSQDWNGLGSSVRDLANAFGESMQLVSPVGHSHPEYVAKFDEITSNFRELLNTLSSAMAELQRQIQADRLRQQVIDVLQTAKVDPASPKGKELLDPIDNLTKAITSSPTQYGRDVRNSAVQISTKFEALLDEKQSDPAFAGSDQVKSLSTALDLHKSQTSTSYASELEHHRVLDRNLGGGLLALKR